MATGLELMTAMMGQRYKPVETGYGMGAQAIAGALPSVVSPYASSGQNIASVLGGALVAGLLGYQARKEADERNVLQSRLMSEALAGVTPGRRQAIIKQDPRLASTLNMLELQRVSQARQQAAELAKATMQAKIDVEKQKAIDTGRPFGEKVQPSVEGEAPIERSYGKVGEGYIADAKKRFSQNQSVKSFAEARRNLIRLSEIMFDPSGIGGQEFVFIAAKAMDPDSVVRGSEADSIRKSSGPINALEAYLELAKGKGGLTMKQKAEIMDLVSGAHRTMTGDIQSLAGAETNVLKRQLGIQNEAELEARKKELLGGMDLRPFNDIINQYARVSEGKTPEGTDFASLIDQIRSGQIEGDTVVENLKRTWGMQQGQKQELQPDAPQVQGMQPATITTQIEATFADPTKQGQAAQKQELLKALLKKKKTQGLTPAEQADLARSLNFFGLMME